MTIEIVPIVVEPSGDFLGDDGQWSTFSLSVGTPPQQVQVLASTNVAATWVVAPEGCSKADATNCTATRGGTYDDTKSSSWNVNALYELVAQGSAEGNLGYSDPQLNGTYGYDKLEIQGKGTSVPVDHQVVTAIASKVFYVGSLGLSNQPNTFGKDNQNTSPSLLTSLKNQNLIPSMSYGYTAGAFYQQKTGVNGSLTLGGYDASRFTPNDVSIKFAPTGQRQLVAGVRSITYSSGKTQTPLLSEGVLALVDSTVPYLWLPESVCTAFEDAFGITWDPARNLYLVNDTLHDTLLKQNPSVVFEVANGVSDGPSVNITFPYASFDLPVVFPLVRSPSRYFPLQRAAGDDAITLGRAFLQESFLIVDYEHSNFSVSQATFDPNTPSQIIAISASATNPTTGDNSAVPTSSNGPIVKATPHSSSHGVGTGVIAGIAIAVILIATAIGAFFFFRHRNRNNIHKKRAELEANEPKDIIDMDSDSKHDFASEPEVKKSMAPLVTEVEVPMTPPLSEADGNEYFTSNEKHLPQSRIIELPGSPGRSQANSPEPYSRSELPSPNLEDIRSELSTPDPSYSKSELPTPDNPSHELESPGISSNYSGQPSPALESTRSSAHRPHSERMDSSESEAGFTRDALPCRNSFFHRYTSSDSLQSSSQRPRNSRMDSSDSDANLSLPSRLDESSESEAVISEAIISPMGLSRPRLVHVDSSANSSERAVSIPSTTMSQQIPRRPLNPSRMDSSESGASSSASPIRPPKSRQIRGLATPFHSSSSSRPAIRRSVHDVTGRSSLSRRSDSSDGEVQQTWLDSASTETPSDVSRFPSVRERSGVQEMTLRNSDVPVPIVQPRPVSGAEVEKRTSLLREEDGDGKGKGKARE